MAKRYWINYFKDYLFTPSVPANDTTSQTGPFKVMIERLQNRMTQEKGVPWYQDAPTTNAASATHIAEDASTAHGGSIRATQKDGTAQTFRPTYNFTGPGVTVTDDSTNNRSNIDIPGGGGAGGGSAHVIQEEGTSLTARTRLNFRGVGSTATDDAGNDRTNVDIRGNVHRSTTAPTSPVTGELWADTNFSPEVLRIYNGAAWVNTSGTPADGTVTDVKVAAGAGIAKSKLAALAIDTADLAAQRSLQIICTSTTRPASPLTGQPIYETDTEGVYVNTGTPGTPVWTSISAGTAYQGTDYISGLQLTYDAANTLGIEAGAAYIPGNSAVTEVPTRLTRSVTFNASENTFRYVYLWLNTGTPDIEISQTAPDATYRGTARTKTGDNSRRYLGAILPNGTATPAMVAFKVVGDTIMYNQSTNFVTPFVVASNAQATAETTVPCGGVVPATAKVVQILLNHNHTATVYFGNADDTFSLSSGNNLYRLTGHTTRGTTQGGATQIEETFYPFLLSSAQTFSYMFASAPTGTNGLYAVIKGYKEGR